VKVRLSAAAKTDLREIGDWIGRDSSRRAASFVEELVHRCQGLSLHPRRNTIVMTVRSRGIRRAVHGDYLLFYEIGQDENEVVVLRILHGARDYQNLFDGDRE
jgi:toxin ParE1/3/4